MSTVAFSSSELQTEIFGLGVHKEKKRPAKTPTISNLTRRVIDLCMEPDVDGKEKVFEGNRLVRFLGERALMVVYDRNHDHEEIASQQMLVDVHGLNRTNVELDHEIAGVRPGEYLQIDDLVVTTDHEAKVVRSLIEPDTLNTVLKVEKPATEYELQVAIDTISEFTLTQDPEE